MKKMAFRLYKFRTNKFSDRKAFFRNLIGYSEFLLKRTFRSIIQIFDALFSIILAPFGLESEIYSNYLIFSEEKKGDLFRKRYQKPY